MLKIVLAKNSQVEDLFISASRCSKPCVLFCNDIFCLVFESVQDDSQHAFVWVADEADGAVVLALLQISFLCQHYH